MKRFILSLFTLIAILSACQQKTQISSDRIKVGVFNKNGDSPYCITDAVEALEIDHEIDVEVISAADILSGKTYELDVILLPGGSGRAETGSLGELGQQKLIDFVKQDGKGIIGICAGAYVLSYTPNYPCLRLSGGEGIDLEHDHRGHGLVQFSLTESGKQIFPELADRQISYSQYYEGPVLIPAKKSAYQYNELATMQSDVHTVEGSPANMTNNRPFIILTEVEKGKTASIIGHPESTPGMRWMIPRLARIVSNKEIIAYSENVVRPNIYTEEIIFTTEQTKKQREAFNKLLGSKEDKLKAMQDIVNMSAWSAKKWIPPMVRDTDFDVRLLAAKLTVQLERTDAIPDLEAAISTEKDDSNKNLLQEQLQRLVNLKGCK